MTIYPTIQDKKRLYDSYAKFYAQRTKAFTVFLKPDYTQFLELLPGREILDLGSGPGRDSSVFKNRGFQPTCLDIAPEMLKLCSKKGLKTIQMNIEQINLPKKSFAGVWSYTSLTTIPKNKVWKVINNIHTILKPNGLLFLGLIEGEGEGWKAPDQKYTYPRYISRYQIDEVITKLKKRYLLIYFRRIDKSQTTRNTYLNFLFKKLD